MFVSNILVVFVIPFKTLVVYLKICSLFPSILFLGNSSVKIVLSSPCMLDIDKKCVHLSQIETCPPSKQSKSEKFWAR